MTTTTQNLEAVTRLLERKQQVPSKMIRDLVTDCKAYQALSTVQAKRITELEAAAKAVKEGTK